MSGTRLLEEWVDVPTLDGTMNTFVARPPAGGPHPVVVVLMDAPGLRPALQDIARRIATAGCAALLPNLYYRLGRDVGVGPTRDHPDAEANRARLMELVRQMSARRAGLDANCALDWAQSRPEDFRLPAGAIGYCMSGAFAVVAAAAAPQRWAFVASYYGTRLVTDAPDSPHLLASGLRCPAYFAFAEHDPFVPASTVEQLRAHFAAHGVAHRVETYPACEHGFAFSDRGTYDRAADERHWRSIDALLAAAFGLRLPGAAP